jgi:hypothetical protein
MSSGLGGTTSASIVAELVAAHGDAPLVRLSHPLRAAKFLAEECWLDPCLRAPAAALIDAWEAWSRERGAAPGPRSQFGRVLVALAGGRVRAARRAPAPGRPPVLFYEGVGLREGGGPPPCPACGRPLAPR